MEDFAVTCPLVPGVPHLRSGSQTPSHDDALALLLAFGSSYTWLEDFHPDSSVPCPAHTLPSARFSASAARAGFGHKQSSLLERARHGTP